ncbi:50S ribosomal protein L29 [Anaerolineales bacterium HSG24]|nr:50S ribosomal protein L29 [Anaerolineales bacterium HSG24]
MQIYRAYEIRNWSDDEIRKKLDDSYQELFNLRFRTSFGQLKDTTFPKEIRKNIARMKTVLNERKNSN